jgi:hypothetical protein
MGFNAPYSTPYWEAPAVSSAESAGWPCSIDGIGYLVDTSADYQRSSISVTLNKQTVYQQVPSESLLLAPEVWRRVRESWHQGDHQSGGDREDSLVYRFSSSRGVDPWTKWQLTLLPDVTQKVAVSAVNPFVAVVGGQLAVVDGVNLRWYADAGAAAVTRTLAASAVSVTQSGSLIYVACSDGNIYQCAPGGTISTFMALAGVTFITYLKDFLLAATTNVLYNVTSGAAQIIRTHPLTAFRWIDGAEGMSCVYLLGGSGDKWVVHRLSIDESATTLNPPIVASMLPDGETGKALGAYMGYVFVGTDKGLRFAVPQSSGDLTLGPLIATSAAVRCFEGQGRFVWFGLSNYDTNATGLGRVDLTTFTEPLAPASASDLTTTGVGEVTSVTTWLGKTLYAVASLGVYIESSSKVPSGYLIESDLTFGVPDTKNGHYAQIRSKAIDGTATLDFAYDDKAYVTVASILNAGESDSGPRYLNGAQFGRMSPRISLTRSGTDATKGPVVTRWEVRAEPVTGKGSQWQIPVVITCEPEVNGRVRTRSADEDRERLIALVATGQTVIYREGNLSWQVHIMDYVWKPSRLNKQNSYEGVLTLLAREVK